MKKLIIISIALLTIGCAKEEEIKEQNKRIKIKASTFEGHQIVEVDGVEYLTNHHGGIIKL